MRRRGSRAARDHRGLGEADEPADRRPARRHAARGRASGCRSSRRRVDVAAAAARGATSCSARRRRVAGHAASIEIADELPPVYADRHRVHAGAVESHRQLDEVHAAGRDGSRAAPSRHDGEVLFSVADTGPGIPQREPRRHLQSRTGRPSAPSAWAPASGCRSRRASSSRTAAGSGWRASREKERSSSSRCPWRNRSERTKWRDPRHRRRSVRCELPGL